MLREGPIPVAVHALLDYGLGALFVVSPFLLGFDSGAATAAAIVIGVLVLGLAAITDWPPSLVKQVPVTAHAVLDYLLAPVLIAAPFLFGFSDETEPTAFFIGAGVGVLFLAIGTRWGPRRASTREA